jgi:hypothetical protein
VPYDQLFEDHISAQRAEMWIFGAIAVLTAVVGLGVLFGLINADGLDGITKAAGLLVPNALSGFSITRITRAARRIATLAYMRRELAGLGRLSEGEQLETRRLIQEFVRSELIKEPA